MSETLNELFKEYGKMYASSEQKKMESNVTQKSEVQGISMRSARPRRKKTTKHVLNILHLRARTHAYREKERGISMATYRLDSNTLLADDSILEVRTIDLFSPIAIQVLCQDQST